MRNEAPILLVEDDEVDAMTVRRALKELRVTNPLHHRSNGEEALEFLRAEEMPRPSIILLDLNMPRMNGLEFLEIVKADDNFKNIPIIVLTTSKEEHDRHNSFEHSVAGYMQKPVDYQQFVDVIRTIKLYWTLSELPDAS
ncbi:MAG: response regulator [Limisphaerales bacterium]